MKKKELSILIALGMTASFALSTGEAVKAEELSTQILSESAQNTESYVESQEKISNSCESEETGMSSESAEIESQSNEIMSISNEVSAEDSDIIYLSNMEYDASQSKAGYGSIMNDSNINGGRIKLIVDGECTEFEKGMAAHATSTLVYNVESYKETYSRFISYIGVDQSQGGSGNGVQFSIYTSLDNNEWTLVKDLGVLTSDGECAYVDIDISNANYIKLYAYDNGSNGNDHAVYGDAKLVTSDYGGEAISSDILKEVYEYDEILNALSAEENMTVNEMTILRRDFVNKMGYDSIRRIALKDTAYKEAVEYLLTDETALRYFVAGGDVNITGSYTASLKYFADIYEKYAGELKSGDDDNFNLRLAVSIALAYAKEDLSKFWISSDKVRNSVNRYEIYKELISSGRMDAGGSTLDEGKWSSEQFKALPVTLMKWVVDNRINDDDILWLADYALSQKSAGRDYLDAYNYIEYTDGYDYERDDLYDSANYEKYNSKYNFGAYFSDYGTRGISRLWMVFEEGSVCGGLAKTYSNLADTFGRPSSVVGQPGHAATITYVWNSSNNRYEWIIQNDISGWVESGNEYTERMLGWGVQDWSKWYSASYAILASDAVNDYDNYVKAAELNILAESYSDSTSKREAYLKALEYQEINLDSMEGLINTYKSDSSATSTDYFNLGKRIIDAYTYYPQAMVELLGLVKDEVTIANEVVDLDLLENNALIRASNATAAESSCVLAAKQLANEYLGTKSTELASFSFDGEDAGKIVLNSKYDGSQVRIKYSLDGGTSWSETDSHVISLTQEQISSITSQNDIHIGLVGGNDIFTIDILDSEVISLSTLYNNDLENLLIGATENLEFSLNDGVTWCDYVSGLENGTRISGDTAVKVRYKANGCYLAGDAVEYIFTEDTNTDERSYLQLKNVTLVDYASENNDSSNAAANFIDGNYNTGWHTRFNYAEPDKFFTVSFDSVRFITDLEYTSGGANGRIKSAEVYTSLDGENWVKCGSVTNLANNNNVKNISLDEPTACKYLKLVATETYGNSSGEADMYFCGKMLSFFEDTTKLYEAEAVIEYSTTNPTDEDVIASVILPEGCTIIGEDSHVFSDNGSFTFRFLDANDVEQSIEAEVDWINKESDSNGSTGDSSSDTGNSGDGSDGSDKPSDDSADDEQPEDGSEDTVNPGDNSGDSGSLGDSAGDAGNSGDGSSDSDESDNDSNGSSNTGKPEDGSVDSDNASGDSSDAGNSGDGLGESDNSGNGSDNTDNSGDNSSDSSTENGSGDTDTPGNNPDEGDISQDDSDKTEQPESGTSNKKKRKKKHTQAEQSDLSGTEQQPEEDESNLKLPDYADGDTGAGDRNQSKESGWKQNEDNNWSYYNDGQVLKNQWISDDSWYYLNDDGIMAAGWNKISESWYYFNTSGAMETGWVQYDGSWYYLKETGAMSIGWIKDNGKWYYLKESGIMATGWIKDNGKWYYLNADGSMSCNTYVDGYYLGSDGAWIK